MELGIENGMKDMENGMKNGEWNGGWSIYRRRRLFPLIHGLMRNISFIPCSPAPQTFHIQYPLVEKF